MTSREHSGDILLPPCLHDFLDRTGRGESGLGSPGSHPGRLNVRVCGGLVVVEYYEKVIVHLECRGNRRKAHICSTQITAESDRVDLLLRDLSFLHQRPETR